MQMIDTSAPEETQMSKTQFTTLRKAQLRAQAAIKRTFGR